MYPPFPYSAQGRVLSTSNSRCLCFILTKFPAQSNFQYLEGFATHTPTACAPDMCDSMNAWSSCHGQQQSRSQWIRILKIKKCALEPLEHCNRWFSHSCRASWHYQSFIYSPTDAQVSCLKNNIKISIKIYIKTAPTCFSVVTPSSGSALIRAY